MAHEHVEIEPRGDLDCGRGVQQTAEHGLEIEDLALAVRVVPEFFQMLSRAILGERRSDKIEVRFVETAPAGCHPVLQHCNIASKKIDEMARKIIKKGEIKAINP